MPHMGEYKKMPSVKEMKDHPQMKRAAMMMRLKNKKGKKK